MTRAIITRRTIPGRDGFKTITIVTKGSKMGKRGPQRKPALREANGRLDRRTAGERYRDAITTERREALSVVINQPHRRDAADPEKAMLHAPLGRFCLAAKCDEKVYEGIVEYAVVRERYRMAVAGGPKGVGTYTSNGSGNPDGPAPEQIDRWRSRIKSAHEAVHQHCGPDATQLCCMVSNIAVFHRELSTDEFAKWAPQIRHAMGEMAFALGALETKPHPFK